MHYYLADQQARLVDDNAAALLLDLDGNVTETSTANFLLVEQGSIVSPSLRNTLPGVSRATVIEVLASTPALRRAGSNTPGRRSVARCELSDASAVAPNDGFAIDDDERARSPRRD